MIYLELLAGFLWIGCFSFGGAYSAIPLIREVVLAYGWLDEETLSYVIAVSESTPGPIMVNMATYIGASRAGVFGAALATAAVVLPAFVIVLLLMAALKNLLQNKAVQALLGGMKSCVVGIVLAAGVYMILKNCFAGESGRPVDLAAAVLTAALAALRVFSKKITGKEIPPILLICVAGVAGIAVYGWK